jgi:hypothetical protein
MRLDRGSWTVLRSPTGLSVVRDLFFRLAPVLYIVSVNVATRLVQLVGTHSDLVLDVVGLAVRGSLLLGLA